MNLQVIESHNGVLAVQSVAKTEKRLVFGDTTYRPHFSVRGGTPYILSPQDQRVKNFPRRRFKLDRSLDNLPHNIHRLPTQPLRRRVIRGFGEHPDNRFGVTGTHLHPAVGPVQA